MSIIIKHTINAIIKVSRETGYSPPDITGLTNNDIIDLFRAERINVMGALNRGYTMESFTRANSTAGLIIQIYDMAIVELERLNNISTVKIVCTDCAYLPLLIDMYCALKDKNEIEVAELYSKIDDLQEENAGLLEALRINEEYIEWRAGIVRK